MRKALWLLVAIVYAAGIVFGVAHPSTSILNSKPLKSVATLPPFWRFISIFSNNMYVAALLFAASVALLPGLIILFGNGYALGSVSAIAVHSRGLPVSLVLATILPHGVIEIPAILYAGVLGLDLLYSLVARKRISVARYVEGMALVIVLLLVAAFIESYITPLIALLVSS